MAISLVGTAEGGGINAVDIVLTLPALQENDVVYVIYGHSFSAASMTLTINSPAGYTNLFAFSSAGPGFAAWRKVQGSTPDTSITLEMGSDATYGGAAVAVCLRGVDTTTPEDAAPTTISQGTGTIPNPPSITTVTNNAWVIACGTNAVSDTSLTPPTGYSNQVDVNAIDTSSETTAAATKLKTPAGVEDPAAWTGWSTAFSRAASIAVRPAAATPSLVFQPPYMQPLLVR